jgi:hypothetical protein
MGIQKEFVMKTYPLLSSGIIAMLACLSFAACGPNVSGETDRWNDYNQTVDAAKTNYPAFGKYFDQKRIEIKAAWDALGSIGDENERAKRMREVNSSLSVIAIKLREFEIASRNIPTVIPKIQTLFDRNLAKYPDLERFRIQFDEYSRQGLAALQKAREMVLTAFPAGYDEAFQIFSNAWRLQKESYDKLNKLRDDVDYFIKEKIDAELEAKKEKKTETKGGKK